MSPEEIYGAGTDYLGTRFDFSDASTREQVMQDMIVEDDALKPLIDSSRLDQWYQTALAQAKDDYKAELHEETDTGGMMEEMAAKLDDLEEEIRERESKKVDNLLYLKPRHKPKARLNGSANNFRGSLRA